ncbi:hypothetical protein Tsubulata_015397 [Turnera subulata]|uniref:Uncharacterized protein n=1 Tax=Turnera subulata TaxID=218843 RepID=A0A9Q0GCZ4_9ROSI|nr:hypothetical protein Tsubulata_015397 [Turnera subulata]
MEIWRGGQCFKQRLILSAKCRLLKLTSSLRCKTRGNKYGLMSLYKDMESCGEYTDIQVMWEMIHSSCNLKADNINSRRKRSYWTYCFRPT